MSKDKHRPGWLEKMPDSKARMADACARYKNHELKERGPDRWYISDGTSHLWAEIACLRGGRIVVIGDGLDIIVRCSDWNTSTEGRLGGLAGGGAGYIAPKADDSRKWSLGHALEEVWDLVAEWAEDLDVEDWTWERAKDLMRMLRYYDLGQDHFIEALIRDLDDAWEYDFGIVVKQDVYMAIAAARRTIEILDKEGEDE
jgi:hypothetical protein